MTPPSRPITPTSFQQAVLCDAHLEHHSNNSVRTDRTGSPVRKCRRITNQKLLRSDVPLPVHLPVAKFPFHLDYTGGWWNAQALFASDPSLQERKQQHMWSLLNRVDFAGMAETHGTDGHATACTLPDSSDFFWSHGETRFNAGVGLAVKKSFLQHFNPPSPTDWCEMEPGRLAKLPLRGPNGSLDLVVAYLPTGSGTDGEKKRLLDVLLHNMAPREEVLTLVMGDWNFVTDNVDRFSSSIKTHTGQTDKPVADHFHKSFIATALLAELEQDAYTHQNSLGSSRIDRIYSTHCISDQLDRHFSINALHKSPLSTHRPLIFSRKSRLI